MSFYQFMFTLLVSQAIVIVFAILSKINRRNLSYIFLTLFFINLFVLSLAAYLYLQDGAPGFMRIGGLHIFSFNVLGPILFLFLKIQFHPNFRFSRIDLLNIIPFFTGLVGALSVTFLSFEERFDLLYAILPPGYIAIERITNYVVFLVYAILCYRLVQRQRECLKEVTSDYKVIELQWAQLLVGMFICLWILGLAIMLTHGTMIFITITLEFYVGCFFAVAFMSHHYSRIFLPTQEDQQVLERKLDDSGGNGKYRTSPLSQDQLKNYCAKLQNIIDHQPELFFKPNLQLSDLARKMALPAYLTSQIVNEGFGRNFYDLVNEQRILQVKRILKSEEGASRSLLDIAFEVGFNSKSTFNQSFKKYVGVTPSEFRKSNG